MCERERERSTEIDRERDGQRDQQSQRGRGGGGGEGEGEVGREREREEGGDCEVERREDESAPVKTATCCQVFNAVHTISYPSLLEAGRKGGGGEEVEGRE